MSASGNLSFAGAAARAGLLACLCALSGCGEAGPDAAGAREALHALLLEAAERNYRAERFLREMDAEAAAKRKARGEKEPLRLPPLEVRIEAFELLSAERAPTEAAGPDETLWHAEAHFQGRVLGLAAGTKVLRLLGLHPLPEYGHLGFEGRYRLALRRVPGAAPDNAPRWEVAEFDGRAVPLKER